MLGEDFVVLYEVHGAKFILIEYRHCTVAGLPSYRSRRADGGHWCGDLTRAEVIPSSEALQWLLANHFEPPDSLAGLIEGQGVVDPSDVPATDESDLGWAWPLYPLAGGAGTNYRVPRDAGAPGEPINLGRLRYYVPTVADLDAIRRFYADDEPGNPSWARVESDLIAAGHSRDELPTHNALTLIRLLTTAAPDGDRLDQEILDALADRQRGVLIALLELKAFDAEIRQTRKEIAPFVEGEAVDPQYFGEAIANLANKGLVESRKGKSGGSWLTKLGRRLAERLARRSGGTASA